MKKPNKTCMVCGKQYYYCPHCDEQYRLPRWLGLFHNENCKTIFNTVSDYAQKVISLEEARKILDECDLSLKDSFNKKIIELLNSIYGENKETEDKTENDIAAENTNTIKVSDDVVAAVEATTAKKKRKKSTNDIQ